MSDIAMSNETDLDWMARTEHHWPKGAAYVSRHENAVEWHYVELAFKGLGHFTHDQWLARRAELQNKPSWGNHPDAKCFVQQDNGIWFKQVGPEQSVTPDELGGWAGAVKWVELGQGEVLGDWRDTLERRPESTRAEMEVELVKAAFKPFTSIEDNQGQEMKQDNGWFERGELPPVGTACEYTLGANAPWYQCEIKYVIRGDGVVMKRIPCGDEQYCGLHHKHPVSFRPIRTERDALLSVIVEEMNRYDTDGKLADAILAAGFSLRAK